MATLGFKEMGKLLWEGREKWRKTKFSIAGSGIQIELKELSPDQWACVRN